MRKPNLFIAGAPKSGTTAMNDFLNQHPEIFMAKKEIHFFGSDLDINQHKLTAEEYLDFFKEGQQNKILGESSVWYLFSQTAATEIKTFSPEAKIVIMLRNPIDMIPALHRQNIYDANENIADLEEAISAAEDRKKGRRLPKNLEHLSCLLYTDAVKYSSQVKKYVNVFGRENIHIIVYDDFKEDNLRAYTSVLEFLEADTSFVPQLKIINSSKEIGNREIHQFIKHPHGVLQKTARMIIPSRRVRHFVMDRILKWNTKTGASQSMSAELKKNLQRELAEDINKLSALLQRDLSFWLAQ